MLKKRAGAWVVVVAAVVAVGGAVVVFAPSGAVDPTVAFARAGTLDPTFGSGGIVLSRFGPANYLSDLVRLPDDRIVAAGTGAVARYRRDGVLDRTFGSGGRVLTGLGGLVGLVRRRDGRLVVAAVTARSSPYEGYFSSLAIVRYLPSGGRDLRWGRAGRVTLAPRFWGNPVAMARKSDERLVIVYETHRFCCEGDAVGTGVAVYQLRADGSLDRSFGNGGLARVAIVGGRPTSVVLQPDHRIVVAGYAKGRAMLVRLLPSGRVDRGFGVGGVARSPASIGDANAHAVAVAPGGDLVVSGSAQLAPGASASGFLVARFRADGRLRTSFGTGGVTIVDLPGLEASAYALLREPDGRLVVGGDRSQQPGVRFGLARLLPDGRLDRGFGDDGRVVVPRPDTEESTITALVRQSDGRIVAGGWAVTPVRDPNEPAASPGGVARFALMRFQSR